MQLFNPIWVLITLFLGFGRSLCFHSTALLEEELELQRTLVTGNTLCSGQQKSEVTHY